MHMIDEGTQRSTCRAMVAALVLLSGLPALARDAAAAAPASAAPAPASAAPAPPAGLMITRDPKLPPPGTGTGTGPGGAGTGLGYGTLGKPSPVVVKLGAPIASKGLDKEIIRRIVRRALPQFRYCYEKLLMIDPALAGTVVLKWAIGAEGSVTTAVVAETTAKSPELGACVLARLRTFAFPKPEAGATVDVRMPIEFAYDASALAPGPPLPSRTWLTCSRGDTFRATVSLGIDFPDTIGARAAFTALCGARLESMRRCYEKVVKAERAAAREPEAGDVSFDLGFSAGGKVIRADAAPGTLEPAPARACVAKALLGLVVPGAKGGDETRSANVELAPDTGPGALGGGRGGSGYGL